MRPRFAKLRCCVPMEQAMISAYTSAGPSLRRSLLAAGACILAGCAGTEHVNTQQADDGWRPAVTDPAYRAGAGLAIVGAFLLIWINGAVGITDSDADVLYLGVVVLALVGAFVALFRPRGLARAMWVAAIAQILVGVVALVAGIVPEYSSAYKILGLTSIFSVFWVGSALLFQEAAREGAFSS